MSKSELPMWQRWAQFRFSVIGELLSSPPRKGQLQRTLERLAEKTYQHPIDDSRQIGIGKSTIEKWYYRAKGAPDPISALGRKIRSDAGIREPNAGIPGPTTQHQWTGHARRSATVRLSQETAFYTRFCPV